MDSRSIRIPVIFLANIEGAIGGGEGSRKWLDEIIEKIKEKLYECCKEIDFAFYRVEDDNDLKTAMLKEPNPPGYLVFVLNSISGLLKPIILSGKPVVIIAETYGGSGDYLLDYAEFSSKGYPVIGTVTREPYNPMLLKEMVAYLVMIDRLRNTKILFITPKATKQYLTLEYPLSVDLYGALKQFAAITGSEYIVMDSIEFKRKYYDKISDLEAEKVAKKWINEATKNLEEDYDEIVRSARFYLAIKEAARELGINAVAIDCILLRITGELDAWPCLAYMQLWYDGILPVCEADISSSIVIMIGKYLLGLNGFITDPAVDATRNEIIYYHCYAPTNPHGSDTPEFPYVITPAHLGAKKASMRVSFEFKPGSKITAVGLSLDEKLLTIHTSEPISIEESMHACSNKIVAKAEVKKISSNWQRRGGWHRVVFLGDYREHFINAAKLLGLRVLEEDR